VKRNELIFTDRCGLISKAYIKEISIKMNLKFCEKHHYPSVIQICYQGFKGILLCRKKLNDRLMCHFWRNSMEKFKYLDPDDFYVWNIPNCIHSDNSMLKSSYFFLLSEFPVKHSCLNRNSIMTIWMQYLRTCPSRLSIFWPTGKSLLQVIWSNMALQIKHFNV